MYIMIIAIKIRLCHLLCGTTLTTNFGGKSIQVKPSVMQEKCLLKSALVLLGEDVKVAYSCGGLISVKECENGRT